MTPLRPASQDVVRPGPTLRFSTPIRLALVAGLAVAVLALGWMFIPRDTPPIGQVSPSPTASLAPATAPPEPSPTPGPTSTAVPTPTVQPTPSAPATWTGLVWSDPVTPSFTVHLYDLVPWGDGYVAVGELPDHGWASLTSADGLTWTIGQRDFPGAPRHLVALGDELFAFMPLVWPVPNPGGAPPSTVIWRSIDGVTWVVVDSLSWQDAWHEAVPESLPGTIYPDGWDQTQHDLPLGVVDVASGPRGLVAIGNSFGDGALAPIIVHSTDGVTWTPAELPSESDSALLNTVVAHGDRFVVTGATGVWTDPATASAAAWYSDDGLSWNAATIEPASGVDLISGAELGLVWAADDGLVACRGNREMGAGGWRYMDGWVSPDGATWRHAQTPGPHPACDWSASDGTRIVSLGPRDHASPTAWPGVTVASVSTDGVTWQPLELSATLNDRLERFWVVPDGVIYAGEQSFWFGTATER